MKLLADNKSYLTNHFYPIHCKMVHSLWNVWPCHWYTLVWFNCVILNKENLQGWSCAVSYQGQGGTSL